MKRSATSGWVQDYMNDIYREQDRKSPHCYGQFMSDGLKDAVLVDEGAAVDEAVVATALGSSALVFLPPPTTDISQMSRPATTTSITTAVIRRRM